MRRVVGRSEVVTLEEGGQRRRASYSEVVERADRLAAGLTELGVGPGDRVATFCWNTQEHLEAYLAIPCMGAVLHTLNLRLFPDQLEYIVGHADDTVMLVEDSLVPVLEKVAPKLESVRHYVVIGDGESGSLPNVVRYEELLARQEGGFDYPEIDDRSAAALCYTSGTTGNPKGVLYSHRSSLLHAVGTCMADSLAVSTRDRVLPVVPMFHANAWGLAHAATLAGADLVMPGRFLQAEPLARLIEEEKVTLAGAVPTIWLDLLRYADEHHPDLSSLRLVVCGGSAVPQSLMEAFQERHGMRIVQAWGMTETSPLAAVAQPPRELEGEEEWSYRVKAGRVLPLIDIRLMDDEGYLRITDRSKDVIKSGGE